MDAPKLPPIQQLDIVSQIKETTTLDTGWTPFYNSFCGIWNGIIRPNMFFFIILLIAIIVCIYMAINKDPVDQKKIKQQQQISSQNPYQYYQDLFKNYELYTRIKK